MILCGMAAYAATICVNPGGTSGCSALPSAAVAAAVNNDVIVIKPGTYSEPGTINITKTGLKISGENPTNTRITNAVLANVFTVPLNAGASAEISGLTITGGLDGIQISGGNGAITIHHNHIVFNGGNGISESNASFVAYNNIILSNNLAGINGFGGTGVVYNNIVGKNSSGGISDGSCCGVMSASYNSSYGNGIGGTTNYSNIDGNIGNLTLDCLFVGTGDYRLQAASPCRDTGNPGFFDVDGTRSDMGSFGGTAAAAFWPYGNGGPVITDLTLDPVIVPRGGTLSINATGEIR